MQNETMTTKPSTAQEVFTFVKFPNVSGWPAENLTADKPYRVVGLDSSGIPCVLDDLGEPWPLDDGYGCRIPSYIVIPDSELPEGTI